MKDYTKLKEILITQDTLSKSLQTLIGKYGKIAVTAVDTNLAKMCYDFVELLKLRPPKGKYGYATYTKPVEYHGYSFDDINGWLRTARAVTEQMTTYVDSKLQEQKPAWQVMAEKNGWIKLT